jgi:hypothetical protein
MMNIFELKRGDRSRPIEAILEDPDSGIAADLTGCTVLFLMKNISTGTVRSGVAQIVGAATDGRVRYSFAADDVSAVARLRCEWEVTNTGTGLLATYPSSGYDTVVIAQDLNP